MLSKQPLVYDTLIDSYIIIMHPSLGSSLAEPNDGVHIEMPSQVGGAGCLIKPLYNPLYLLLGKGSYRPTVWLHEYSW